MIVWLIRHPAVEVPPVTCYGRLDVPLREPAAPAFARIVADLPSIRALRTSPSTRCRRLAVDLAGARGLGVVEDARWQELDFGDWEGRSWNAVPREAGEAWADNYWTVAPPGGETYGDLMERVRSGFSDIAHDCDTAVVTHAGPIRAALALCLAWPRDRFAEVEVGFGEIIGLRRIDRGWVRC